MITPSEIEQYCLSHTTPMSPIFQEMKDATYAKVPSGAQMQVGFLEGSFLKLLIEISGAKNILELGTFTGFSALAMAEALPEDGRLITCDIDPKATTLAQEFWNQSRHGKKIELRLGPALSTIATLDHTLDFVFIDADKGNYIEYWEACLPKVKSGGLIAVDNVLWKGKVLNPQEKSDHQIHAFNEHAKTDSRVQIVMLPVRDGLLLARKI